MNYTSTDNLISLIRTWIKPIVADFKLSNNFTINPLPGDASIRKYYLLEDNYFNKNVKQQFIIMQTSIDDDLSRNNFIKISNFLNSLNIAITVPKILAIQFMPPYCFMLISYLGDKLLFNNLNLETAEDLYALCLNKITSIQSNAHTKNIDLPCMGKEYILHNLILFKTWYLETHLNLHNLPNLDNLLLSLEKYFLKIFTSQPQVFVHIDYHSKNILLEQDNKFKQDQNLGILDFQDAMIGPLTYDIGSLLQDAYIDLPNELIEKILFQHHAHLIATHENFRLTKNQLLEYFYLTVLQRHLKNLGIFARLKYFYKKPDYIKHIPNLLKYINRTCELFQDQEIIMLKNLLTECQSKVII